jgi:GNAT superfamily N-acetyltransferase
MDALQDLYGHLSPDAARCPPDLALRNLNAIAAYDGSAVLVGMTDGALVTSCTLIVIPNLTRGGAPYGLIENVVTETAQRGQGFGRAILDAASDRAWDHGCYKIMLSTGSAKPETLAFYEAAGFEQSRTGFQKRKLPRRAE